ncbi:SpaA isopeptide-forming pilin-related protein [Eubacterium sp. 1001713B170207_170306_E7]|uniref:SpaA isopeptide-forming pilin-related protein n=1 Tax=Eubacterium sp. 1001713B170207_170306_E7 TaxID=2787097 RepID=UPI0018971437|nr:SpaA isopeptide-forming pilin-related protein [Eubacterium sp. 1001713B170207_170306_E7]
MAVKKIYSWLLYSMSLLLVLLAVMFFPHAVRAEGSINLTENGGYRPYTEWSAEKTSNMERKQIIKVYANSGETLYFGSSVTEAPENSDVVIWTPSGSQLTYDNNKQNKTGYIENRTMEKTGPAQLKGESGYKAQSYTVEETGVYEFEFHSQNEEGSNPVLKKTDEAWNQNNGLSVAAWDITVVNTQNQIVTGRVYADYLTMNMGLNKSGTEILNAKVYVLTHDGYLYQTDFNGMNPYGFVFFGNNRGLYNSEGQSAYYSTTGKDNSMETLTDNLSYNNPKKGDDELCKTFKIFFNKPAEDLPESIVPSQKVPVEPEANSLKFIYDKNYSENEGVVGKGGDFLFTLPQLGEGQSYGSFQIEIQCDPNDDNNVVYLSQPGVAGENKLHWDGKDTKGQVVKQGKYTARLIGKGGEYHFMFMDVETNEKGVINQLMNPLSGQEGTVYNVYYDNSKVKSKAGTALADGKKYLKEACDSSQGAFKYNNQSNGDYSFIDSWTYSKGNETPLTFSLDESKVETAQISGFVFKDSNRDGKYEPLDQDGAFSQVKVSVKDQEGNVKWSGKTDATGMFRTGQLPKGEYTVEVINPGNGYFTSTKNENQKAVITVKDGKGQDAAIKSVGYALPKADLVLTKINTDTGSPVEDMKAASFTLTDNQDKNSRFIAEKGSDGSVTFKDIPYSQQGYTLKEETAPDGYEAAGQTWKVTIDQNAQDLSKITFKVEGLEDNKIGNTPALVSYKVIVHKMNDQGDYTDAEGFIREETQQGKTGIGAEVNAQDYLTEADIQDGYVLDEEKIKAENNSAEEITKIVKTINSDGTTTFDIYLLKQFTVIFNQGEHGKLDGQNSNGEVAATVTAGTEWSKVSVPAILPDAGYQVASPEWKDKDSQSVFPEKITGNLLYTAQYQIDPSLTGSLTLTKTDGVQQPLEGAAFGLFEAEDAQEPVAQAASNAQGQVRFEAIQYRPQGYWLKEISAPAGYTGDTNTYPVSLLPNEQGDSLIITVNGLDNQTVVNTANEDTKYTVEAYYQQLDGTYKDTPDIVIDTLAGTTGEQAVIDPEDAAVKPAEAQFVYDEGYAGNVLSAVINGNGSTVLKVYYKLVDNLSYTVEHYRLDINPSGEDREADDTSRVDNVRYGTTVNDVADSSALTALGLQRVSEENLPSTITDNSTVIKIYYDRPAFSFEKQVDQEQIKPGESLTYRIEVKNLSYVDAEGITIEDVLPVALTPVQAENAVIAGQKISWTGQSLAANESKTYVITAKVAEGTANGTVLKNTALLREDSNDPEKEYPSNEVSTEVVTPDSGKVNITFLQGEHGSIDSYGNITFTVEKNSAFPSIPSVTPQGGWKFTGWLDQETNYLITDNTSFPPTAVKDKTYVAQYESQRYTVTFNSGAQGTLDSGGKEINHVDLSYGKAFPAAPELEVNDGFAFTGWLDDTNGSQGSVISADQLPETVTENKHYTAQYVPVAQKNYMLTVHYVYEDGTIAAADVTQTLKQNQGYSVASPVIDGFTPNMDVVSGTMGTADIEITIIYTAVPAETYTVAFNRGEHGAFTDNSAPTIDNTGLKKGDTFPAAPAITPEANYTFDGWVLEGSDGTVLKDNELPEIVTENAVYTAVYTPVQPVPPVEETHTVIFLPGNNGQFSEKPEETSKTFEGLKKDALFPAAPGIDSNEGYIFTGWTTPENPDVVIPTEDLPKTVTGNATYIAHYEPVHTVTFMRGDHGSIDGILEDQQIITDILHGSAFPADQVPGITPETGYEFIGWAPGFPDTVTGNLVFVAQYQPVSVPPVPTPTPSPSPTPVAPVNPATPGTPGDGTATPAVPAPGATTTTTTTTVTPVVIPPAVTNLVPPVFQDVINYFNPNIVFENNENTEEIDNNQTPLAQRNGDIKCWVHWLMLLITIIYVVYAVVRIIFRKRKNAALESELDDMKESFEETFNVNYDLFRDRQREEKNMRPKEILEVLLAEKAAKGDKNE